MATIPNFCLNFPYTFFLTIRLFVIDGIINFKVMMKMKICTIIIHLNKDQFNNDKKV